MIYDESASSIRNSRSTATKSSVYVIVFVTRINNNESNSIDRKAFESKGIYTTDKQFPSEMNSRGLHILHINACTYLCT
jgi:hypothetical protein